MANKRSSSQMPGTMSTTKHRKNQILKPLQHGIEVLLFSAFMFLIRRIPKQQRANYLGKLLGFIGPKIGTNKRILANLEIGMPGLEVSEKTAIAQQVWVNLGRNYAELTFGAELAHPETGIISIENFSEYERLRDSDRGIIMIGAHYSNWELGLLFAGYHFHGFMGFYRRQNNAKLNAKINALRTATGVRLVAKNDKKALKAVLTHLRAGGAAGFLMDQNFDQGEEIPFLDVPARTMPIAYSLARATGAALLPYHLRRNPDGGYTCFVGNEVALPTCEDPALARQQLLTELNDVIGGWIKTDPGQWFWLHKRWRHKDRTKTKLTTLD